MQNYIQEYFQENESAVDFANRVKKEIAKQGGLVDLSWWVYKSVVYC